MRNQCSCGACAAWITHLICIYMHQKACSVHTISKKTNSCLSFILISSNCSSDFTLPKNLQRGHQVLLKCLRCYTNSRAFYDQVGIELVFIRGLLWSTSTHNTHNAITWDRCLKVFDQTCVCLQCACVWVCMGINTFLGESTHNATAPSSGVEKMQREEWHHKQYVIYV